MSRILLGLLLFIPFLASSQTVRDYTLELQATSDNGLKIFWKKDPAASHYILYKKDRDQWSWNRIDSIPGLDSFYRDPQAVKGLASDYRVEKYVGTVVRNGYLHAGLDVKAVQDRGILLLLTDSNYRQPLQHEIARLVTDLQNEFWEVKQHTVERHLSPDSVKAIIRSYRNEDTLRFRAIFLLGRIPVPYSGQLNPDAHPDHQGAWPADVFYTTFDLNWTDNQVNSSSASRPENRNVPGDGKYDPSYIWPALSSVMLGRVDLTNMPSFGNDTLLTRRYLDKNHRFRTGQLPAAPRGIIDDNFGVFGGEAFASAGWRNFSALFGDSVYNGDYRTGQSQASYLFSYGCGGGSYTSAAGIGNSGDLAVDSLLNPFTMLFGSYFGDWDNADNFLRAPLASKGWGLVSAWSGRPHWFFHHSALGEPVGMGVLQAQNSYPTYDAGFSATFVHIALMGDPSLKLFQAEALKNVTASSLCETQRIVIDWDLPTSGADSIVVFTLNSSGQRIQRRSVAASVPDLRLSLAPDTYTFEIRALKKITTASGSYFEYSLPDIKTITLHPKPQARIGKLFSSPLCPGDSLVLTDNTQSNGPLSRIWTWPDHSTDTSLVSARPQMQANPEVLVVLKIETWPGCFDSDTARVPVNPLPDAQLTLLSDSALCAGDSFRIQLTDHGPLPSKALWLWGDGSTDSLIYQVSHRYPLQDTVWQLTIITQNDSGCIQQLNRFLYVNPVPVADFLFTPDSLCVGSATVARALGFFPHYNWQYGTQLSSSSDSLVLSYQPGMDSSVFLRVENSFGCRDSIRKSFRILPLPHPFSSNGMVIHPIYDDCFPGSTFRFIPSYDTASHDFTWTFGDGSSSSTSIPSYRYSDSGTYTSHLLITSRQTGCARHDSLEITASTQRLKPELWINGSLSPASIPQDFFTTLRMTPVPDVQSYEWLFDGGTLQDDDSAFKKTWNGDANPGLYRVLGFVIMGSGCHSDTAMNLISLRPNSVEEWNSDGLKVFPNPASNRVQVVLEADEIQALWLIDLQGKQISVPVTPNHTSQHELDTSALPPGSYWLLVYGNSGRYRSRILLIR